MGVKRLLDAEDIVEHQEQKSIITYLLMCVNFWYLFQCIMSLLSFRVHKALRPHQNLVNLSPTPGRPARPRSEMPLSRYNTAPMKVVV